MARQSVDAGIDGSSVLRGVVVLATLALLAALAMLLDAPGYHASRLAFFAVLAVVALAGAAGTVTGRERVLLGSGVGLFLLGFWQAVLWVVVLPVAGVHLLAGAVLAGATVDEPGDPDDGTERR